MEGLCQWKNQSKNMDEEPQLFRSTANLCHTGWLHKALLPLVVEIMLCDKIQRFLRLLKISMECPAG